MLISAPGEIQGYCNIHKFQSDVYLFYEAIGLYILSCDG